MLTLSIFVCTDFSEAEINVCANSYAFRMSASKSCDEQIALEVSLNFEIKMSNIMLQLLMQTYGHGYVLFLAMIKRPNVIKWFYPIVVMMVMVKSSVFGKVHS